MTDICDSVSVKTTVFIKLQWMMHEEKIVGYKLSNKYYSL